MPKKHDLTLTYDEGMNGVSFDQSKTLENDGWNAKTLHLYSHVGTHMDAPVHFGINGPFIDEYTPENLIGRAWLVNLSGIDDSALIRVKDVLSIEEKVVEGDSIILKTGWSKFVGLDKYRDRLPRISLDLAEWIVKKKIKMLGVEPPSVADVNNLPEVTEIHETLFKGGVIIIEGLCNLEAIQSSSVTLIALPLKIKHGDGAPARVIAIEN